MLWQRAVTNILIFVSIGFSEIDQTLKTIFWGGVGEAGVGRVSVLSFSF